MLWKVRPPYLYNPKGFACNLQAQNVNHELESLAHLDCYINTIARKTVENQAIEKQGLGTYCVSYRRRFIGCPGIKGNILL